MTFSVVLQNIPCFYGYDLICLVVDAAYEGMEKRTFLAMILLAATHLPFLVGLLLLYKPLQAEQASNTHYSKLNSDQSDNE